jgi:hypothetical protein
MVLLLFDIYATNRLQDIILGNKTIRYCENRAEGSSFIKA